MEFNIMMWVAAFLPIIILLFLMSYIKMNSRQAALISLGVTILLSTLIYQFQFNHLWIAVQKGVSLSLYVILIIVGAVFLYNIVDLAGGFNSIKAFMKNIDGDRAVQFILLSWAFSGFIQGVTGFGVPIAIVGALLIGTGYEPLKSITAVLVGHSWAISFGSMGSSFFALQLVTDLEPIRLGITLALFFFIPVLATGIAVAHIYGGLKTVKNNLLYILPVSLLIGLAQLAAAAGGFAHVGALMGGIVGTSSLLYILFKKTGLTLKNIQNIKTNYMPVSKALFPYAVLIGSVLIFQIPLVNEFLPKLQLAFSFPGFTTNLGYQVSPEQSYSPIKLFSHPIFFLGLASFTGLYIYIRNKYLSYEKLKKVIAKTYNKAKSSVTTVLILMIMALIMNNSGMIFIFAKGMANFSGRLFPLFSPFIGILGAFLTGSNTSSNVLFGAFQMNTAELLDLSPVMISSTQSLGGSLGSAIAPAKILLGTSVVGILNKEGEIIKRCIGYTLTIGLIVGLVSLFIHLIYF
ncbi:MAG: L-lactate permease [Halanaerobiales bacterium]